MPEFKGNVLRSGFGAALKHVSCTMRDTACHECILKTNCAYSQIFETPIPEDSKFFKGRSYVPHPFVLEPPLDTKREYSPEDEIAFRILLVGRAIEYLPYFVLAFYILGQWGVGEKRGERSRCFLEKVESINIDGQMREIYIGEIQRLTDEHFIFTPDDIYGQIMNTSQQPCHSERSEESQVSEMLHSFQHDDFRSVTLDFLTPTRIQVGGRLQDDIDFETLIRALLRRLLALSYFHCGEELNIDYQNLVQQAIDKVHKAGEKSYWRDWSRYSRRQNTRMKLGGFKGKITFTGELDEFMPLLALGEYIHVGKGTAFGLGKYAIDTLFFA